MGRLHLQAGYQFPTVVVGTSHYRRALATIAGNVEGHSALVLCTAHLVRDPANPFDANAVAVHIGGQLVGHLPRALAAATVNDWAGVPADTVSITTDAAITGGLVVPDRSYEYAVELDFESLIAPDPAAAPTFPDALRLDPNPAPQPLGDGRWFARIWLPDTAAELHPRLECLRWTTERWDTVNFYVMNRQGIGLGFKVLSIPKDTYQRLRNGRDLEPSLDELQGRFARLVLTPD